MKFLSDLVVNLSKANYTMTTFKFKTHSRRVVDYMDLHLTFFIVALFSLFIAMVSELIFQNKVFIRHVCFILAIWLLSISYDPERSNQHL